jgi:sugar diacid utilization regulator
MRRRKPVLEGNGSAKAWPTVLQRYGNTLRGEARMSASTAPEEGPGLGREQWLRELSGEAAQRAGAPEPLLGAFVDLLADAALHERRPGPAKLAAMREIGRQAAVQGVGTRRMVSLYLAAAAQLWATIPPEVPTPGREGARAAAEAVLAAIDAMIEGHDGERRSLIRQEEATRRDLVEDLLRGGADPAGLAERAAPFGLDLTLGHQVAVTMVPARMVDVGAFAAALERSVADRFGGREVLAVFRQGQFVVIAPESGPGTGGLGEIVRAAIGGVGKHGQWQIGAGRAYAGAYGIARAYTEAREVLRLAQALKLKTEVVNARDLLMFRVLGRDPAAVADLVSSMLEPLRHAALGPGPLLATLRCYFETGGVITQTARKMHLSARAVSYRLARVAELTGCDLSDPTTRFSLQAAVLCAQLLDWPDKELPAI